MFTEWNWLLLTSKAILYLFYFLKLAVTHGGTKVLTKINELISKDETKKSSSVHIPTI